jgi:hypothetical protein
MLKIKIIGIERNFHLFFTYLSYLFFVAGTVFRYTLSCKVVSSTPHQNLLLQSSGDYQLYPLVTQ